MQKTNVWLVVSSEIDNFHDELDAAIEDIETEDTQKGEVGEVIDIKFSSAMMANDMEYQALIIYKFRKF